MTDSAIIRLTLTGTIRRTFQESYVLFQPIKRGGPAGGLLIINRKGAVPDTLYQDLSSREVMRLATEVATWRRAQKARNSTAK